MERTGDEARARQTLLKIALAHHLAFDYARRERGLLRGVRPTCPRAGADGAERADHLGADRGLGHGQLAPGYATRTPALEVTANLFRGLVAIGPDFDLEPDLAERFSVSDDGRSYTVHASRRRPLERRRARHRRRLRVHLAQMAEDDVSYASWLDGVSASAVDERTLEIRLREPRNHFLYCLGQPALFPWPRHVYERRGT